MSKPHPAVRVPSWRAAEAIRALDALGDEAEQAETLDFLMKALDEDRPRFRGCD